MSYRGVHYIVFPHGVEFGVLEDRRADGSNLDRAVFRAAVFYRARPVYGPWLEMRPGSNDFAHQIENAQRDLLDREWEAFARENKLQPAPRMEGTLTVNERERLKVLLPDDTGRLE